MPYVSTFNRNQMMMCSWDSFVDPESIARIIDAFINSLDLSYFRKDNIDSMKRIFYEFKRRISGAVEWGFTSIDEYLRILKDRDEQSIEEETEQNLTREVIEVKLAEAKEECM